MNKRFSKCASASNGNELMLMLRQVKITFACATLLGCTWALGLFAVGELTDIFQWLFTIFNSLQGLFIFVLYTLTNSEVQKAWLACVKDTKYLSSSTLEAAAKHQNNKGEYEEFSLHFMKQC